MDVLRKYFYGEQEPQEEAMVQSWLAEHADDPEVVKALDEIMSEFQIEDRELSSRAFASVKAKLGLDRRNDYRKILGRAAGVMARTAACLLLPLLGALGYALLRPGHDVEWLEMKVPAGHTCELMLSDGTHLHLNSCSRVTYPSEFSGEERRIFVEGEVFAEVARQPEHPFVIVADDVDVEVLGTTFNLKAYDDSECVELLLIEGAVKAGLGEGSGAKEIVLDPGEMVQYDRSTGNIELKGFDSKGYRPFCEGGAIHFFNIRLGDIVADLERLFDTRIVLVDESMADMKYFAWFTNNETLEQILQSINVDGKMRFIRKNGVIYISRKQ